MWETLPPFGDLPFLNALILEEMKAVKQIGLQFYGTGGVSSAFPSLERLKFQNMEGLEHWNGGIEDEQWFPCLRTLMVTGCPKLRRLPPIPLSLKELDIILLGITALPRLWMPPNQSHRNMSSPSFLSSITILRCSNLKSLAEGLFQDPERLMLLEDLTIWDCYELVHLPVEGFEKFVSLKRLVIQGCEKLLQLPMIPDNFLPPSIHYLVLKSCGDLDVSLPRLLHGLTSLTFLTLADCLNLTSLPSSDLLQRLTALTRLMIENCRELTSLGGLEFLPSLQILAIKICRKLVGVAVAEAEALSLRAVEVPSLALDSLDIDDPSLLLLAPLRSLTSVKSVDIKGCSHILALLDRWLLQNRAALQVLALYNAILLQSLPDSLQRLSSLQLLVLRNVHQLQKLPELPRFLKTLDIDGCHPALFESYKRDGGSDWRKIAHVTDVFIMPI